MCRLRLPLVHIAGALETDLETSTSLELTHLRPTAAQPSIPGIQLPEFPRALRYDNPCSDMNDIDGSQTSKNVAENSVENSADDEHWHKDIEMTANTPSTIVDCAMIRNVLESWDSSPALSKSSHEGDSSYVVDTSIALSLERTQSGAGQSANGGPTQSTHTRDMRHHLRRMMSEEVLTQYGTQTQHSADSLGARVAPMPSVQESLARWPKPVLTKGTLKMLNAIKARLGRPQGSQTGKVIQCICDSTKGAADVVSIEVQFNICSSMLTCE